MLICIALKKNCTACYIETLNHFVFQISRGIRCLAIIKRQQGTEAAHFPHDNNIVQEVFLNLEKQPNPISTKMDCSSLISVLAFAILISYAHSYGVVVRAGRKNCFGFSLEKNLKEKANVEIEVGLL